MTSSAGPAALRTTSLRTRWRRSFGVLTAVVVLAGLVGLAGTRLLVEAFRGSAVTVEREATVSADLRADILAHAVVVANAVEGDDARLRTDLESSIRDGFGRAVAAETDAEARSLMERSQAEWERLVADVGPADGLADLLSRGATVSVRAPVVLALLDESGSTSRAAVRSALDDAARLDRAAMLGLAIVEVLALFMTVRLARRLSDEILVPVGMLRDSAERLSRGELDHRVAVGSPNELGQLAASFNAMAESIAGNHRALTAEAATDSLSGLPNRAAFRAQLEASLARPGQPAGAHAVLFVDLDDFKDVNDSLGHNAGDELLAVVARRLGEAVRPGDVVARLGGDEFAVLLDRLVGPGVADAVAQRVVASLAVPVRLGAGVVQIGASIGLAMSREDSTVDSLTHQADVAMYAAKAKGKNCVEHYDAGLHDRTVTRRSLLADVATATRRGELVLEYQPVVDLRNGTISGFEALVRWEHPDRGRLEPSVFIRLAEENGAIVEVGAWVLETATLQVQRWQRRYARPDLWVAVNASARELESPGFAARVGRVLANSRLDPHNLVVEVTESIGAEPFERRNATLLALRASGVRVALDHFGTGSSSIAQLRHHAVDILKIDRSFLQGSFAGGHADALLEGIVAMAQHLGLEVVPEGIEDVEQLSRLRAMGCQHGQGFVLSPSVPAYVIEAWLGSAAPLFDIGLSGALSQSEAG